MITLRRPCVPLFPAASISMATLALLLSAACAKDDAAASTETARDAANAVSPNEASAIAEEAYVYAFPMMEGYRTMYLQAIDRTAPGYLGSFNQLTHEKKLLGPDFKDIVRPNNDTMYSFAWLDLRAQPVVITVPEVEDRYFSVQLVDMFTHNLGYLGTRATGGEAGSYVIAGPGWRGSKPGDTKAVFRSESNFVYCIFRIEVRGPGDVSAVRNLQERAQLTPMNVFLGRSLVPAANGITFPAYDALKAKSAGFIDLFNFLLAQVAIVPEERELMDRFAKIGVQPGAQAASLALTPALRDAVGEGVGKGIMALSEAADDPSTLEGVTVRAERGWEGVIGLFGSGGTMRPHYLARAVAAMVGLYGNDAEEAYYPTGSRDASGNPLDGSKHRYIMRFETNEMPLVEAFWSMTMYSLPDQLMVENQIARYSIGDRSKLRYAQDGSLTIYIQRESPGKKRESNWLPAPDGPFSMQFRMYVPKPEALDPPYLPPSIRVAK